MSNLSQKQFSRIIDAVSGYCNAAPDSVKAASIYNVVARLCKDVGGIAEVFGPIPCRPSGSYVVVAPFGGIITDIESVCVDGRVLANSSYRVKHSNDGTACVFVFPRHNYKSSIVISVLWRPSERTTQMPEGWFEKHFSTIEHGVIAEILSQYGTAWANPELSAKFEAEYARDVQDIIIERRGNAESGGRITCYDPREQWI